MDTKTESDVLCPVCQNSMNPTSQRFSRKKNIWYHNEYHCDTCGASATTSEADGSMTYYDKNGKLILSGS